MYWNKRVSIFSLPIYPMKIILSVVAFFILHPAIAQTAFDGINFQAVARNSSGAPLANTLLGIRVSITNPGATGSALMSETHTVTTNAIGLFSLIIGTGTPVVGSLASIAWENSNQWLKIEIDNAGGSNYQLLSTTRLVSVPFSIYAGRAKTLQGFNLSTVTPSNGNVLKWDAASNTWKPGNIAAGNGTVYKPATGIYFSGDSIHAQAAEPIWNASKLHGRTIATAAPLNDQVLKWDATLRAWTPKADDATTGWSLRYGNLYNSNTGFVGIGDSTTTGRLNVFGRMFVGMEPWYTDSSVRAFVKGSVLFTGTHGAAGTFDPPPINEWGSRFMWYSSKSAIRAGLLGNDDRTINFRQANRFWDKDSVGEYSAAFGKNVKAKGTGSFAAGEGSEAIIANSVAMGYMNYAYGGAAFGSYNKSMSGALVAGFSSLASDGSTALGNHVRAEATNSFAAGHNAVTSVSPDFAMNDQHGTISLGYNTNAQGYWGTTAIGNSAVAKGRFGVMAIGDRTKADGNHGTTAMGYFSEAYGWLGATALGAFSIARGESSIAIGYGTIARSYRSTALGVYNDTTAVNTSVWIHDDPLLVVGNGDGSTSETNGRKNAFTILKNGSIGIGKSNPLFALDIRNQNTSPYLLRLEQSHNAAPSHIAFANKNFPNHNWFMGGRVDNTFPTMTNFVIGYDIGSSMRDFMVIDKDGKTTFSGQVYSSGTLLTSDVRFKQNISEIDSPLQILSKLNGKTYQFKTGFKNKDFPAGQQYGFIAQELEKVLPSIVVTGEEGYKSVNYDAVIPILVESVKQQQQLIEHQQKQIDALTQLVEDISKSKK